MADFNIAIALTLQNEGGFQKNPNDPGNWTGGKVNQGELRGTKFGIAAAQFPSYDIENLTQEEAANIYEHVRPQDGGPLYWNPLYSQIESQAVASKLFDLGVLFGVEEAVKMLQAILIHMDLLPEPMDGGFGPITLAATNKAEGTSLLSAYKNGFVARAFTVAKENPSERQFVSGWVRRINQ